MRATPTANIASNLTFATLPLTFLGRNINEVMAQNLNPAFDLPDIQQDIPYIQHLRPSPSTGAGTRKATTSSRPTRTE